MHMTSTHLAQWSDKREAQGMLPILVRRLVSATSHITALAIPGGDSVNLPGWDGIIDVAEGNPWVPSGVSFWEMGTSKDPISKANTDFKKRLEQMLPSEAAGATFVFVTSRRWAGKNTWQEAARKRNVWANVLVWDADDLEAWLETSPSTALWLSMQLGVAGQGIEAVEARWEHWSNQSSPAITASVLLGGREVSKDTLKESVRQGKPLITVVADSQSEAVAFICAVLIEEGHSTRAACVTSENGWQFVDANPGIELVVITDNRVGSQRAPREGMSLIVPMAVGDQVFSMMGIGEKAIGQEAVELRRPKPDEFEKSLLDLGVNASDAARYTRTLGRSWTVFRRWHAQNPAIRKPVWADAADTASLSVLTLVGAWNSASEGDQACIAQIANRSYEEVENELVKLATLDDSPVVRIGSIWKAKAPLELLHLIAPNLTDAVLARFFQVAGAVFEKPDPVLELEEDKRWMASVYGKVREQSSVILEAMAESIAKLGYFSDSASHIVLGNQVRLFIAELLGEADGARWLSVSPHLCSFAEAAPDEFLSVVESSLQKNNKPVTRLISETQSPGISGRCWHAELLWALELLAWYPTRLSRVANVLAELSDVGVEGKWSNTPFNSLVSLFRSWYPQTAAPVALRIRVLKNVVGRYPQTAWKLLLALLPGRHDTASPNAKPRWRDEDAGAGAVATNEEIRDFVLSITDLLTKKANGNAQRIADLVPKIDQVDASFRDDVIALIDSAKVLPDEDREIVRDAVRRLLNWENSFNQDGSKHDRYSADALRPLFDTLAADDVVIRHAWMFSSGGAGLPDGAEQDYEEADRARAALRDLAMREIYNGHGWQGIEKLAKHCGNPSIVGWGLVKEPFERNDLAQWLCQWFIGSQSHTSFDPLTEGVLHAVPQAELVGFLQACSLLLEQSFEPSETIASFLVNAPQNMVLWLFVETLTPAVREYFWLTAQPSFAQTDSNHLLYCIEKLLSSDRPRTAMQAIMGRADGLPSEVLIRILRGIVSGQEREVLLPDSWCISRVFKALANAGHAPDEMASLEFAYYPTLVHEEYGTPHLMAGVLGSPEYFMELICLTFKPQTKESDPIHEKLHAARKTAATLIHSGRGIPGKESGGEINKNQFFSWINRVRELAKEKDRAVVTDQTVGAWLSDWPLKKKPDSWPAPVIAELLDQDDCEQVRLGFYIGVRSARGVTSRMPYDGGDQERTVTEAFRGFAAQWQDSKPYLAELIEEIAKSFEHEAGRSDVSALWAQEL